MDTGTAEADSCSAKIGLRTLEEACRIAASYVLSELSVELLGVESALGRLLGGDVHARVPLPPFDQSAMDGYAIRASDVWAGSTSLPIASRFAAGDAARPVGLGHAARVFTGAPLPPGFDTVVMQEHVRMLDSAVVVEGPVRPGSNVRRRGEDCHVGQRLLQMGARLEARAIAMLAAQGLHHISVRRRPRIAVISTGNELQQPGGELGEAAVYDSNRPMLIALAQQAGADVVDGGRAGDDPAEIAGLLAGVSSSCDLVVTTGGVSVGDEDHSAAALSRAEAEFTPLRIALKPGKPAIVGRLGRSAYLGLPGSPNAALVGWLTLGGAMLAAMNGRSFDLAPKLHLPLAHSHQRFPGRREFIPARVLQTAAGPRLEFVSKAGSGRLLPLLAADGFADLPYDAQRIEPGELVGFHPFTAAFQA